MLIEYTEPRIHVLRGLRVDGHQVEYEFRPGVENEVPEDVWEHLKKHSGGCKALLRQGKLREVDIRYAKPAGIRRSITEGGSDGHASDSTPESKKLPAKRGGKLLPLDEEHSEEEVKVNTVDDVDVTKMTSFDAIDFIGKVFKVETLTRFQKLESKRRGGQRKTVLAAIEKQMEVMNTDPTRPDFDQPE